MTFRGLCILPFLLGCGLSGTISGTLTNALTGAPIPGVTVVAKATESGDMTCGSFAATTDEAGAFTIVGTCGSDNYIVHTNDKSLLLSDMEPLNGGNKEGVKVDLKAWKAPAGFGYYQLSDGKLKALRKPSDLERVNAWKSDKEVQYPKVIPSKVPRIDIGDKLLITGNRLVNTVKITPLIASGSRRLGNVQEPWTIKDAWFVGVKFSSDSDFEEVTATIASDKTVDVSARKQHARYIDGDAVTAGRYILTSDADKRRGYVVDFGAAAAAAAE